MRTQYLLYAPRCPADEVVKTVTRDSRQVIVSIKPSRVDCSKRVRSSRNGPMRTISTVAIDITPAGIKATSDLQGLVDAVIKNDAWVGFTGATALRLPLRGKNAHPKGRARASDGAPLLDEEGGD